MTSPAPIARHNSTVSGRHFSEPRWADLDFSRAWIDAGFAGAVHLKVPCVMRDEHGKPEDEALERVRHRRSGYVPVKREDGVWCWGRA